jgi:hypothetical protein
MKLQLIGTGLLMAVPALDCGFNPGMHATDRWASVSGNRVLHNTAHFQRCC